MTQGQGAARQASRADACELVAAAFARRIGPGRQLADDAVAVTSAAHAMATRFHNGGKLLVFGPGAASADARHVAVEFMHPVIVGKRVLPAISLTSDPTTMTGPVAREGVAALFTHQLRYLAEPGDIALGIAPDESCDSVRLGLSAASDLGLLTIALLGGQERKARLAADHVLTVASADPRVVKEIQVTMSHLLWELVHVFFEQPAVLGPAAVVGT